MALITLRGASLAYGHHPLLDDANMAIEAGERVCIVGRNGAGKSTLLKVIAGEVMPDHGEVQRRRELRMAMLPQALVAQPGKSVYDVVAEGLGPLGDALRDWHHESLKGADANLARLDALQKTIELEDGWRANQRIESLLQRFGLDPDVAYDSLSGGWKRRALLARAVVPAPDLILLDEPTNHLDIEAIEWLEAWVREYPGAVLFISHDRAFLDRTATRIVELDRGKLFSWPAPYERYLEKKDEWLNAEAKAQERFDKKLAQEETWIRQGIKARRTRNEGRVRALKALREQARQRIQRQGSVSLQTQDAERSGKVVVRFHNVSFGYNPDQPQVRDLTWTLQRGDRVGILGPNGVGKSTLIKLVTGELSPQSGTVKHGTRLEICYFDQSRDQIHLNKTVWDNVAEGKDRLDIGGRTVHVAGYLQSFLFDRQRLRTPASALSGGEINRLLLAKLFTRPFNLLIMDEPTNDLDIETLEVLETMLTDYDGTLLLVSHDRAFLDNVVTSTLVAEGDGHWTAYAGGYTDWLAQRPDRSSIQPGKSEQVSPEESAPSSGQVPRDKAVTGQSSAPGKKKLSYKYQRELEQLPNEIEALEARVATLEAMTQAPDFYTRDHAEVTRALNELAELQAELEQKMERWMELEELAHG
ncbi:MAG: ATP-binding cassette domain-containing protein [Gammaproteobacteria bacterium]|nr:MAG: ATP-binding cassette domain-containing protein [Gammaproteobacteria bacterium]